MSPREAVLALLEANPNPDPDPNPNPNPSPDLQYIDYADPTVRTAFRKPEIVTTWEV